MDGISQPAIEGFNENPLPGQQVIPPGIILVGEDGDINAVNRPSWAKGGSFMVFRQLKQMVPEFNKFINDNAPVIPGLSHSQSADVLGGRVVGRWKSVRFYFILLQMIYQFF
jgi:deferrochelatase/peroxidase EfeB